MRDWWAPNGWYDRNGIRITDADTLTALLTNEDYRRVAETVVGPYWVSTVWLGFDHRVFGPGRPVIFETMVFLEASRHGGPMQDFDCRRYSTEAAALEGHEATVLLVEATRTDV